MPEFWFFLEVLVGGLLSGTMYALVALGFVLIYKASSVFNFAQGAMVFFAVLSFVGFMELGLPFWAALPVTVGLMMLVGTGTERFVLRPLVNQSEATLLMATIGLAFVIEGVAQLAWGVDVRRLDLGIRDEPINWVMDNTGMLISQLDVTAAAVAGIMVAALALLFSHTKVGRGLRAVADDHAAALSIGIPLKHIWMLVWATAGVVALVAGMLWGARSGVQFALVWVALKALPVLIIGGFTSVPGVIVAGLIVGAFEKIAEVFSARSWRRHRGLVAVHARRPWSGRRVCSAKRSSVASDVPQFENSVSCSTEKSANSAPATRRTSQIFPLRQDRVGIFIILIAAVMLPFVANSYWLSAILVPWLVLSLVALGQNILMGYAGQLSLGSAGFMAVGAFACYNLILRIDGIPFVVAVALSGVCAALVGIVFGLPSLRIRGLYLAVATLASQFFIVWALDKFGWFKNYDPAGVITAQPIVMFGHNFATPREKYWVVLAIVAVLALLGQEYGARQRRARLDGGA